MQERYEDYHEMLEMEAFDASRRRHSHEILSALEEVQIKRRLSLSLDDTFGCADFIDYGIGGRRGSLSVDHEPPVDESCLQKAISCESINSDTSVAFNDLDEAPTVGLICVALETDRWGEHLMVSVVEARDLTMPDGTSAQTTFAR